MSIAEKSGVQNLSESEICTRVRERDPRAEAALVEQYRDVLVRQAQRWVVSRAVAEDLAHDTLEQVLRKLRTTGLAEPNQLSRYIRRTLKFMALNHLRRHSVARTSPIELLSDEMYATPRDQLLDLAARECLDKQLEHLLQQLTQQRDRNILRERYLAEKSKQELCRTHGLHPAQFDRVLHRARARLLALIKENAPNLLDETFVAGPC